ncbi:MAG: hypothetical protein K9I82_11770 [Chitinophagaceae bacterium]|nr:hypothetical protein [Chitinophagaceae bacterium]
MSIQSSLRRSDLVKYVTRQCNNFFYDTYEVNEEEFRDSVDDTLKRVEYCFSYINLPYYKKDSRPFFNHLNGDHYSIFLCYLSQYLYSQKGNEILATKIFLLNKLLFGIDAFYKIQFPDIFLLVHPLGTVMGRAEYKNNLVIYQGVTIGATTEGIYPIFSENTILYSNSSIIGNCKLGANLVMGANSSIVNFSVEDNMTVVGSFPQNRIFKSSDLINHYFLR